MHTRQAPRALFPVLVVLGSAAYFAFNGWLTLEWADEGQLVYPSWRVAEGALPYRDFEHIYGPSLFFLNGALLKLFGAELAVVRIGVLVVKTAAVLLTFELARRAASLPLALGVAGLLTLVWGTPWPFFTTPYASNPAFVLGLLGAVVFLAGDRRPRLACLTAGICFGAAATFKQTTGLFLHLALLVHLLAERPTGGAAALHGGLSRAVAGLRPAGQVAILAFGLLLPLAAGRPLHALALGAPLAVLVLRDLLSDLRDPPPADVRAESALRAAVACAGALLPVAGVALFFAAAGALPALVDDTLLSLPRAIEFFQPVSWHLPSILPLGLFGAALFAAGSDAGRPRLLGPAVAVGLAAGAVAVIVLGHGLGPGWAWRPLLTGALFLLPFLIAWLAALLPGPTGPPAAPLAGALAATGLLNLHPAADEWHAYLALPVFLPAAAAAVQRALPARGAGRPTALVLLTVLLVLLAWPFLRGAERAWARGHGPIEGVERARGIRLPQREQRELSELVRYLGSPARRDREVWTPSGQSMLYFLSQRTSPLDESEFLFYLIGFDLVSAEEAQRRFDGASALAVLERVRPLVVEDVERTEGFRTRLPELGAWLDERYRPVRRIGRFRVLDRNDAPDL